MISVGELIELLEKHDKSLMVAIPMLGYDVEGYELLDGRANTTKVSIVGDHCDNFEDWHVGLTYKDIDGKERLFFAAHTDVLVIE